jgi:N-acetylneuraminate lyase
MGGLLVCGTTGEGPLLTTDERRSVAEAYVKASKGRVLVAVQVGHASVEEARLLARHAQEIGAQAVAATAPFYLRPSTVEGLVGCAAQIARGAPDLPFFYYHIPALTRVELPMPDFMRLAAQQIPNFAGMKFTSPAIDEYQACLALSGPHAEVLFGLDEMLLSGLVVGASGAIGSTYNFAAPLYQRLWAAFDRGDLEEARRCQAKSVELVRVLSRYRNLAASKAVMNLIGLDCGPTRLPILPLSPTERGGLERDLRSMGFFEWGRSRGDAPAPKG